MSIVFDRPHALVDKPLHYCPGCTHGIIHRLVAEVIDELGIEGKTVGVSPVGCTYNNYEYFNLPPYLRAAISRTIAKISF